MNLGLLIFLVLAIPIGLAVIIGLAIFLAHLFARRKKARAEQNKESVKPK